METQLYGQIPGVAKQVYYAGQGTKPTLVARYYRKLGQSARVILDVGCGTGDFGRLKPSPDIEVHGVDADPTAIAQASTSERALEADLDAGPLPYPDGMFDAVLAKDIFEHVRFPGPLAREIHRIMKPGGVLIASVVMARPRRVWADYTHLRGFTRDSARLLLEDAGFRVEETWRMGGVPLSSRLGFIDLVPHILRVPVFDSLWGSSWELKARK